MNIIFWRKILFMEKFEIVFYSLPKFLTFRNAICYINNFVEKKLTAMMYKISVHWA
jgi:hypothetical protein